MRSSLGQRSSALRNRFRPSERRANQLWKAVIVFAVVLPLVSMGWEMIQHNLIATIVFAVIILTWAAVMWWGWRQGSSGDSVVANASATPRTPEQPSAPAQQAPKAPQTEARKTSGRQARRK